MSNMVVYSLIKCAVLYSLQKDDQEDSEIRSAKLRHIIEHALD